MKLDFDTRLSWAFIAGIVGLMEQAIASSLGEPVSRELVVAFLTMVVGPLLAAIRKGSNGNEPPSQS